MSSSTKPVIVTVPEPDPAPVPIANFGQMKLYLADSVDYLQRIEDSGVNIYYVIGNHKITEVVNNVNKVTLMPNFFRVEKSLIGRAIVAVDIVKELKIISQIETGAKYYLPKMPYEYVQRNDAFFRKADLVHGTEAILVLTYDPTYLTSDNPSDGWGIIVPDQENTSAHCKYEPQSVMEHKPEHVQIVGTWHSHPNMSAFFSGTDHQDQDDWDGIHITTGWKGNGPSEYHIALVMAGKNWLCDEALVFAPPPVPDVSLEGIDEMVGKVKKKAPVVMSTSPNIIPGSPSNFVTPYNSTAVNNRVPTVRAIKLPLNAPKPTEVTIVAYVNREDVNYKCPFCRTPLTDGVWDTQRCIACQSFLLTPGTTLEELVQERRDLGKNYIMDIDPDAAGKPIVIWKPAIKESDEDVFSEDMRTSTQSGASPK